MTIHTKTIEIEPKKILPDMSDEEFFDEVVKTLEIKLKNMKDEEEQK